MDEQEEHEKEKEEEAEEEEAEEGEKNVARGTGREKNSLGSRACLLGGCLDLSEDVMGHTSSRVSRSPA